MNVLVMNYMFYSCSYLWIYPISHVIKIIHVKIFLVHFILRQNPSPPKKSTPTKIPILLQPQIPMTSSQSSTPPTKLLPQ